MGSDTIVATKRREPVKKEISPALQKLEEDFRKAGGEWREYKLGDLFDIKTGSLLDLKNLKSGNIARVSVKNTENGIIGYFDTCSENNARHFENFITVNFFGNSFYHPYKASVEMKVHVLKLHDREFTKSVGLFLSALLNTRFQGVFGYGNQLSSSMLKNEKFYISLPTMKNHEIDFQYIENYIKTLEAERIETLEAERIETLEAYLTVTGLKDYHLTEKEEQLLDSINSYTQTKSRVEYLGTYAQYELQSLFKWGEKISELNPLHLDSLEDLSQPAYPFYGQATIDNGIISYRQLKKTVLNNQQSLPTLLIHSNNQNIVYLDTPFYLKDGHGATSVLQSDNLNRYTAFYFMTAIKKVIEKRFNYNAKATKIGLKLTEITLPSLDIEKTPDYTLMSNLIRAVEKLVIKELVDWTDRHIQTTKEVVHGK